jgi:hypothetical protein
MHNRREKFRVLCLASAGLLGIVLLAAALGSFTFTTPYQLLSENSTGSSGPIPYTALLRMFFVVLILVIPLLGYLLVRVAQHRRWVLLLLLALFALAYVIVVARPIPRQLEQNAGISETSEAQQPVSITPQPALSSPPDIGAAELTPTLVWLLSLGLAALILVGAGGVYLIMRSYRTRPVSPLESIATSAETALQAIEQDGDMHAAVLRCYASMLAASRQQGLDRPIHLTPAEFIQRLVQVGLPPGPVERLTHLFEAVRYSPHAPTPEMEAEAVDCLQVMVQAARGQL